MRPAASYCLCTEVQQVATATLLTEQGSDIKLDSFHGDTLFHHASAKVSDFKTTGAHLYVCASLPSRSVFTKTQCPSAHVCPFAVCVSPRGVESTKNLTYDQVELSLVRLLFYDSKAVFPKTRVTKSSVSCFVLELT
jgi:hypothetical protein